MTPRRQFAPIAIGSTSIAPGKLALIAGPCVLEDGGMAEEVANELKRISAELDLPFVFKASYSKANRTSRESYRGPGSREGLRAIARIRERVGVPVTSDVHETVEVAPAAEVLDLLQIPAFLCRQTPLIEAAARSGKPIHLKKGQFLDPASMAHCVEKARAAGGEGIIVTERGSTFGYGDLVVDFRSIGVLSGLGCPIFFDATHSVQKPGGAETGGQREFVPLLARAAIAAGADGLFIETHPNPEQARSDRETQWPLAELPDLLRSLMKIHQAITDMSLVGTRRP